MCAYVLTYGLARNNYRLPMTTQIECVLGGGDWSSMVIQGCCLLHSNHAPAQLCAEALRHCLALYMRRSSPCTHAAA